MCVTHVKIALGSYLSTNLAVPENASAVATLWMTTNESLSVNTVFWELKVSALRGVRIANPSGTTGDFDHVFAVHFLLLRFTRYDVIVRLVSSKKA